jgi:hypothetical protein
LSPSSWAMAVSVLLVTTSLGMAFNKTAGVRHCQPRRR